MPKYVPLPVDYELPFELGREINEYIDHLNNSDGSLDDCYRAEIMCTLNWCSRDNLLSEDKIAELRDYYQYKGVYKHASAY